MNKNIIIGIIAVIVVIIAGYYFIPRNNSTGTEINQMPVNSGENAQPGSAVHDLPVEPAASAARADLAAKLGVDKEDIVIMFIEDREWSDGCLGLGGPAESCLMAIVPGFRVELQAKGQMYVYRTDNTGTSVRMDASGSATSHDMGEPESLLQGVDN